MPMLNPWILLGIGLAWLASLVGVGTWQRHDGESVTNAKWQAREIVQQSTYSAEKDKLQTDARNREQLWQQSLFALATQYSKDYENAKAQHKHDLDSINAGLLRLRDQSATCDSAGGNQASSTASAASGGHGSSGCELSPETTRRLFDIANDCDQNTRQLTTCQQIIMQDRK